MPSSGNQIATLPVLHAVAAAARCSPPLPRPLNYQQGRDGRDLDSPKGNYITANTGIVTPQNGSFNGTVHTLTLNVKVKIVPDTKESDNAPNYRVVAGNFEIGAAWKKVSKAERPYLSATLDDPSFPATIYARLVERDGSAHNLIWSRSKGE